MRDIGGEIDTDVASAALIRNRLDAVLRGERIYKSTLVAHMLEQLYTCEIREQGVTRAEQAWMTLDDTTIRALAKSFETALAELGGAPFLLPAGIEVVSLLVGQAMVGSQTLGIDVDCPGLRPSDQLSNRPQGYNLQLLADMVEKMTARSPWQDIGIPSVVERYDDHVFYHFQFAPFEPAGGVVLQHQTDFEYGCFCSHSEEQIRDIAKSMIREMKYLWEIGLGIRVKVLRARRQGQTTAAKHRGVSFRAVVLNLTYKPSFNRHSLSLEYDGYDDTLRRGVLTEQLVIGSEGESRSKPSGLNNATKVAALRKVGADGVIDGVARAVVEAAPLGAAKVLAELGYGFSAEVSLKLQRSTWPLTCRLFWKDGEIQIKTSDHNMLSITLDGLTIKNKAIPETIIDNLPGKPLHLLFDEPFKCASRIESITNKGRDILVDVERNLWLVNCRTGQMWQTPQAIASLFPR